jgi:hypothetical protein
VKTTPYGTTIWLSDQGFYEFSGGKVTFLWDDHRAEARRFSKAALHKSCAVINRFGRYICWVPEDGSDIPNVGWTYDGVGWSRRTGVEVRGCVETMARTRDVLVAGRHLGREGVFVLDRGQRIQAATVDTGWLAARLGDVQKKSVKTVMVRLRETAKAPVVADTYPITVEACRDYRGEVVSTGTTNTVPSTASGVAASFWYDKSEKVKARERRTYWAKVDVHIPACDVYRLKITCEGSLEILEVLVSAVAADGMDKAKVYR